MIHLNVIKDWKHAKIRYYSNSVQYLKSKQKIANLICRKQCVKLVKMES